MIQFFSGESGISITIFLALTALTLSACNLPIGASSSLDATKAVLEVQATMQAQQAEQFAQATSFAGDATKIAQEVQASVYAQQATQIAQQLIEQPSPTPMPPTAAPPATDSVPAVTEPIAVIPSPTPNFEAMMKSANILLFEDMAGRSAIRYIRNALDGAIVY